MRFSEHIKTLNGLIAKADAKARAALAKAFPDCFTETKGTADVAVDLSPLVVAGSAHGLTAPLAQFSAALAAECGYRGQRWAATAAHLALKEGLTALAPASAKEKE